MYAIRSYYVPSDLPLSVEFVVYTMLFEFVSLNEALLLFGLVVAMFLVISWRLDLNIFSAHAIYRNRLVRAYLGASNLKKRNAHPISGFDPRDDLQLADLKQQRPVPIINTTINMTGGDDLAWQTRRAASFTFTPTFVGFEAKSVITSYSIHYTKLYERDGFFKFGKPVTAEAHQHNQKNDGGFPLSQNMPVFS